MNIYLYICSIPLRNSKVWRWKNNRFCFAVQFLFHNQTSSCIFFCIEPMPRPPECQFLVRSHESAAWRKLSIQLGPYTSLLVRIRTVHSSNNIYQHYQHQHVYSARYSPSILIVIRFFVKNASSQDTFTPKNRKENARAYDARRA